MEWRGFAQADEQLIRNGRKIVLKSKELLQETAHLVTPPYGQIEQTAKVRTRMIVKHPCDPQAQ